MMQIILTNMFRVVNSLQKSKTSNSAMSLIEARTSNMIIMTLLKCFSMDLNKEN